MAAAHFPSLESLFACMSKLGAERVVAKPLSENDNIKQQIYLGGNFESLSLIPYGTVTEDSKPATPNLKAAVAWHWINESGGADPAPHTKLILYPKYPEVRLSGFVRGCSAAPSGLLQPIPRTQRRHDNEPDGRILLIGVSAKRHVFAYLAASGSAVSREFAARCSDGDAQRAGVFWQLHLRAGRLVDAKAELLRRLADIKNAGWHYSRRLRRGTVIPYAAPNGAGYTLEALMGIEPNGVAAPDFLGWELKACGSGRVTLMTPEPDAGYYGKHGAEAFLRKYGRYLPSDDFYFTGVHRVAELCETSRQTLRLRGYAAGGTTFEATGHVDLIDHKGAVSASWSFAKLLEHWGRKHALAAYIPCKSRMGETREYSYLSPVQLGEGTSFVKLLAAFESKAVYYDPAPKLERASTSKKKVHARSQFRTNLKQLAHLYETFQDVPI